MTKKKVKKEPSYSIEYVAKCRFCGATVVECESGLELSSYGEVLTNAIHELWVGNQPPVRMISVHTCKDGQLGITDLIGQRRVKDR